MWFSSILAVALFAGADESPKGRLVIAGGGALSREVDEKILEISGGKKAHVVIIPQASNDPTAGARTAAYWHQSGASEVAILDPTDPKAAVAAIEEADLIWFRGGNQNLLMSSLAGTEIPDAIRKRYREGATIGGTSAGAAVMSRIMIAGRDPKDRNIARLSEGLGLWPDVIVDQHFLRRMRLDRLTAAVLDHPELVGIGIDEATAVVVSGRQFEVIGASDVIVLDARKAGKPKPEQADVTKHVLKPGMTYDLDKGLLTASVPTGD